VAEHALQVVLGRFVGGMRLAGEQEQDRTLRIGHDLAQPVQLLEEQRGAQKMAEIGAQRDLAVTARATPAATVAPALTGSAQVAATVSCSVGTWTNAQSYAVAIKVAQQELM
jgi:hypothetical protein